MAATALGLLYCGLPVLALVWLRGRALGLEAVIFLMLCVWSADIFAYFAGRAHRRPEAGAGDQPQQDLGRRHRRHHRRDAGRRRRGDGCG